jgi:hypothetical protein
VVADVWSSPSARLAAAAVFALGADQPRLRPVAPLVPCAEPISRSDVEDVVAALPDDEVSRLVGLAGELAPRRWRALVDEVGAEAAREPLLAGIVTAALSELVPPPHWLVAMREATSDDAPGPLNVLATLLHPECVWSVGEIHGAHTLASALPFPRGLAVAESFARTEMNEWRAARARYVARPVARILPVEEAPVTSRQLADALALLPGERAVSELCELLLLSAVMRLERLVPVVPEPN